MKPIKEHLTASVVVVLLVSLTTVKVTWASPATYFYVDPSYMQGTPTGKFQVAIKVAEAPQSYAWEIRLSWDPDKLELLSVSEGDFLHRWVENPFPPPDYLSAYQTSFAYTPLGEANAAGEILVTCTLMGTLPMDQWASGNGYLLSLTFLAQHVGAASLNLHDTRLWDHLVADYPAATYYPDVDGLVDATNFFFAGLYGWQLKVNGKAGNGKGHGLNIAVGQSNLFETYLCNNGTFAVNVQAFVEIRDSAGYWLATIPLGTTLLQPGESTILSATWITPRAGVYYITAYSLFGELNPTIQSGFKTLRLTAVPISGYTDPPIKVGVIGPMYWTQGIGMWEAAQLSAQKINDAGGINGHPVELYQASTHPNSGTDPDVTTGTQAMLQLMSNGVDFVQGGFRTEAVLGEREVAMDYKKIFTITGASTDELIDQPDTVNYPQTVRANYDRYKYMFRTTPVNSTTLFKSIASFLKYAMITRLMPIYTGYAKPLEIAVVSENLDWTTAMHAYLSSNTFWNVIMGMSTYGGVNVVYANRVDPVSTDWVPEVMATIDASGARLIIEVISGPSGRAFVTQWATVQAKAMLAGIDVSGQEIALHWTATSGKCETESILVTAGGAADASSGDPINTVGPVKTTDFYSSYFTTFGHAPTYTSYGSFDTMMGMKELIEKWIIQVGHDWPPANQDEYDLLIPINEMTNRQSLTGTFKFTGPNPFPNGQTYPAAFAAINPTKMGTLHDIFSNELGPTWTAGYTRALVASWQAGRLEIVFPVDQQYSKIFALPSWMYPYSTDVNQDGKRNLIDITIVSYAMGTKPGDARWQFVADVDKSGYVDGNDLNLVADDYGKPIPLPLP